jgi:hypothetical protein
VVVFPGVEEAAGPFEEVATTAVEVGEEDMVVGVMIRWPSEFEPDHRSV